MIFKAFWNLMLFFLLTISHSQKSNILVFPDNNPLSIKIDKVDDADILIKVNSNSLISINETPIKYWGEIFNLIFSRFTVDNQFLITSKVFIESDKDVDYQIITNIFNEVSRFSFKFVFLRVGTDNLNFYEGVWLQGTTLRVILLRRLLIITELNLLPTILF